MTATFVPIPFPVFSDAAGRPLESGNIYIGKPNLDPQTFPMQIYWDEALTIPAAQPVRTIGGYSVRNGSPAKIFVNGDYSIRVTDKNGVSIYLAPITASQLGSNQITFTPSGTGSVSTTTQSKLQESVSVKDFGAVGDAVTSDQAAITAAVNSAYTRGAELFWPIGNYLTTASFSNFHSIRHSGPGVVIRGSGTFYASPREAQENIIYAASTGVLGNDGLSSSTPTTLQGAFNILMTHDYLEGNWRIKLAAGNYTGGARIGRANESEVNPNSDSYKNNNIESKNFIIIEGPDVGYIPSSNPFPTPTALFDGVSAAAIGIEAYNVKLLIKNLKFSNYNGSTSSGGVIGDGCEIRTENVHTSGCYYGLSNFRGLLEIRGGWLYGSATKQYTGIRSMFLNKHEVGSQIAGGIGQGPKITFCNFGLFVQEGGTGHSDYVQYEDCGDAIRVTVNSRVNYSGSDFKRCERAVRVDFNSVIYESGANYNLGTADACLELVAIQNGGVDETRDSYANTAVSTDYLNTSTTITGTLVSTPILVKTLARGRFAPSLQSIRKPQGIRISGFGSLTGTAGAKQIKIRLGGVLAGSVSVTAATVGSFRFDSDVLFFAPAVQRGGITVSPHQSVIYSNYVATTVDMMAADQAIQFEVQLVNAADSITIDSCVFEIIG